MRFLGTPGKILYGPATMYRAHPYLAPESCDLDHLIAELPRDSLAHVASFFEGIGKRVAGYAALHARSAALRRGISAGPLLGTEHK